jgi:hypothetical protein
LSGPIKTGAHLNDSKTSLGHVFDFALNFWIYAAAEEAITNSNMPPYSFVMGQPGKASEING